MKIKVTMKHCRQNDFNCNILWSHTHTHTHPRVCVCDVDWGLGFVCHFCVSTSSSGNLNFPLLITVALKGIKRISGDLIAPPAPPLGPPRRTLGPLGC